MKRYVVFFGPILGTKGGAADFIRDFSRKKDALNYRQTLLSLDRPKDYWSHVWDTKEFKIFPQQADEYGEVMGDELE